MLPEARPRKPPAECMSFEEQVVAVPAAKAVHSIVPEYAQNLNLIASLANPINPPTSLRIVCVVVVLVSTMLPYTATLVNSTAPVATAAIVPAYNGKVFPMPIVVVLCKAKS